MTHSLDLIESLEQLRQLFSWTDEQLASELGINRATWSLIRAGKRTPSFDVLSAIVQRFPELSPKITLFLQQKVSDNNDHVSVTDRNESKVAS